MIHTRNSKITIIIPNYNGSELLKKNLDAVLKAAKGATIIIVDDASTDESVDFIKKNYPQIQLVTHTKNVGFSSTVNDGVSSANSDIVVLLNTDIRPKPDFLTPLITHFENPNVFAVGCLQMCKENGKVIERGRGIGAFKRGFLVHKRGETDKNTTLWVSAGAAAFRRSMWVTLAGMDTLFDPFYWEDIDLSYRAQKIGYKILFEKKSVVIHEQVNSSIRNRYNSRKIDRIAYRNQLIFMWKNITDSYLLLSHIIWLPFHVLKSIYNGKSAFLFGLILAFIRLPRIIKQKRIVAVTISTSDTMVVAEFEKEYEAY